MGSKEFNHPLKGAVGICNPFDMYALDLHITKNYFGLIQWVFSRNLLKVVRQNIDAMRPMEARLGMKIEEAMSRVKTAEEFDSYFTAKTFGHLSAKSYYRKASSALRLDDISMPMLFLQALDDPVVVYIPFGSKQVGRT